MPDNTDDPSSFTTQYKSASEHWQRQWDAVLRERNELRTSYNDTLKAYKLLANAYVTMCRTVHELNSAAITAESLKQTIQSNDNIQKL